MKCSKSHFRLKTNKQTKTQWCSGLLSTSRGAVDLNEPDLQLLIHHEVEAEELEALVREVSGADGGLHAHEAAPAGQRGSSLRVGWSREKDQWERCLDDFTSNVLMKIRLWLNSLF